MDEWMDGLIDWLIDWLFRPDWLIENLINWAVDICSVGLSHFLIIIPDQSMITDGMVRFLFGQSSVSHFQSIGIFRKQTSKSRFMLDFTAVEALYLN